MLEPIGEPAVRMTTRTISNLAVENRDVNLQKIEKTVVERPVERSQESATPESGMEHKAGGYNIDDDGVFFEKYDKNGRVIFRAPPQQKPIDEHA